MNKKIETFLSHHQFYQYLEYDQYQKHLEEQIDSALSKHNQNQIYFEHNWSKATPKKLAGDYLAMDLGGMYLRLHHCKIADGKMTALKSNKSNFYQKKTYTPDILFSDLKEHLDKFTADIKEIPDQLVFSFANALKPVFRKKSRLDGEILFWGKNHKQEGLLGLHLGHELENYLRKHGYPGIEIHVINDSSLALLSAGFSQKSPATAILNIIVGSGTNISVGYNHKKCFKIINLEFGNLDFFPYSNFDFQLNHQSSTPNKFRTEKLFTGAWQNMLFQIILDRVNSEGLLEAGAEKEKLKNYSSEDLEQYFQKKHAEDKNFSDLQYIWQEMTNRGAFICALGLFTVISHLVKNKLIQTDVVMVEVGALLEHSDNFRTSMQNHLKKLLATKPATASISLETILSTDPTCEGAATLLCSSFRHLGHRS